MEDFFSHVEHQCTCHESLYATVVAKASLSICIWFTHMLRRFWLHEFTTRRKCILGYSTGRELPSYQNLIEQVTAR